MPAGCSLEDGAYSIRICLTPLSNPVPSTAENAHREGERFFTLTAYRNESNSEYFRKPNTSSCTSLSEERLIKYKMTVVEADKPYDMWMANEEKYWVDHSRIDADESKTKYAHLKLEAVSKSGKLTEERLMEHGFLRAPQGVKHLDGDLLKFIRRKF